MNNVKTFKYVEGILNNWKSSGFTKIEEILKENNNIPEEEQQEELFDYDWLNESGD